MFTYKLLNLEINFLNLVTSYFFLNLLEIKEVSWFLANGKSVFTPVLRHFYQPHVFYLHSQQPLHFLQFLTNWLSWKRIFFVWLVSSFSLFICLLFNYLIIGIFIKIQYFNTKCLSLPMKMDIQWIFFLNYHSVTRESSFLPGIEISQDLAQMGLNFFNKSCMRSDYLIQLRVITVYFLEHLINLFLP